MRFLPTFRCHSRSSADGSSTACGAEGHGAKAAFSLLELLTAMSVLAIIVVLLSQILGMASGMWTVGQSRVKNFTKARAMLDLFAHDLQLGVFREDLAAFPNSTIAFYTKRAGIPASGGKVRDVSLVQYSLSPEGVLVRGDFAVPWNAAATAIPFGNTTDFTPNVPTSRDTAPGILGFQVLFVYADGTKTKTYFPNATNPLRSVGITLAVIDDKSLEKLRADQVATLLKDFTDAATTSGVKADWENYLKTNVDWKTYPDSLSTGLKIFERYVVLPN